MSFLNFLQGTERQLNPFDNGATFKNPKGSGQQTSVLSQVKNLGVGLAKGAVSAPLFFLKTDVVNPIKQLAGELTGNQQAEANARNAQFNGATTPGAAVRQVAGNAAQLGLTFLAPSVGGAVSDTVAEAGIKGAAGKLLTGAATGAAVGAPFNEANLLASDQPLTIGNIAKTAAYGAGGGALLGTAGEAIGIAAKNTTPLDEAGSIPLGPQDITKLATANTVKDVKQALKDKVSPEVAAEVAKPISLTNNPSTIQDIIDKHSPAPPPVSPETAPTPVTGDTTTAGQGTSATPEQQRGFIKTVQNAPNVSPEVKAAVSSPLVQRSDASIIANSQKFVDQGLEKATSQSHEILNNAQGNLTDQEMTNVTATAIANDSLGTPAGHEQAISLYEKLAPQKSEAARATRSSQILLSRTPDGLKYQAIKDLGKAGIKVEGDLQNNLNNAIEKVRRTAPNTDEHTLAVQEVQKVVKDAIPSSRADKAFALWRTGLLTGPQTLAKVGVSHVVEGAFSIAKDYPSAIIDRIVSGFSGKRSILAPGTSELGKYGQGWLEGMGEVKQYIQTGLEKDPATGNALQLRNTTNFQHQLLQNYTDWVGRVHGSIYKSFNKGETFRSLFNQAAVDAKNFGLKGEEAQAHIADFMKNPPKQAAAIAAHEGELAAFQQETALGKAASQIQKLPIIGKLIAPFTKIPSAIATNLINATPVGALRTILDGIKAVKSTEGWTVAAQREFSQGLGRSITGTAIMIPGIALFQKGLITLGYPTDPTEQKLWAAEGKQPNSIKIGGKWRSLGSLGPSGSILEIGGHVANSLAQGNSLTQAVTDGFVGGAQSIEEQSYLRGVSGAINALNDPGRYAGNFVRQTAGSIVPTGISTIAAATDPNQRQLTTPLDAIKSRIPGLRESVPAKLDTFGNPLPNQNSGWQRIIDPFQSSTAQPSTPVVSELRRLQDAGFGITPATINKSETFNKVKTPLTTEQRRQLTASIGQATQTAWTKLVSQPGYQNLTDDQKKLQLSRTYTRIAIIQKQKFAAQNKLGRYAPNYRALLTASKSTKKG